MSLLLFMNLFSFFFCFCLLSFVCFHGLLRSFCYKTVGNFLIYYINVYYTYVYVYGSVVFVLNNPVCCCYDLLCVNVK